MSSVLLWEPVLLPKPGVGKGQKQFLQQAGWRLYATTVVSFRLLTGRQSLLFAIFAFVTS